MIIRYILIISWVLGLAGCFQPTETRFVDSPNHNGSPTIKSIRVEGDLLRISVFQDEDSFPIAGIEAVLIEGDVYLSARSTYKQRSSREFLVDMSDERFPRDWRNRLYWIEEDKIASPINPFIEHYREITRSKILLQ